MLIPINVESIFSEEMFWYLLPTATIIGLLNIWIFKCSKMSHPMGAVLFWHVPNLVENLILPNPVKISFRSKQLTNQCLQIDSLIKNIQIVKNHPMTQSTKFLFFLYQPCGLVIFNNNKPSHLFTNAPNWYGKTEHIRIMHWKKDERWRQSAKCEIFADPCQLFRTHTNKKSIICIKALKNNKQGSGLLSGAKFD